MNRTATSSRRARNFLPNIGLTLREATSVQVVSPLGVAIISFLAMLFSVLIPPAFYESVIGEPDLMFANWHVILFYSLSILAWYAANFLVRFTPPRFQIMRSNMRETRPNIGLMFILPLSAAIVVGLITCVLILKSNPGLIGLILSGRGQAVKGQLVMKDNLGGMAPFVLAILNYTQLRLYQAERAMSAAALRLCRAMWWLAFAAAVGTALLKLARYEAIPIVLSWLIIYLRTRGSGLSAWYSIRWGGAGGLLILALFSSFAMLRGLEAFHSLMGYGPASFNHLAALLSGRLQLYGHGVYTFTFVDQLPFWQRFSDYKLLDVDLLAEFRSEFALTQAAGLNSAFIWVTSYGYYYADWGWACMVVIFIIGLCSALSWKSFNFQRAWGAVMYPWLASQTLLSMTCANITRNALPVMIIMALLLEGWDKLPLWKRSQPLFRKNTGEKPRKPDRRSASHPIRK